jgi:hypothetical protein
MSCDFIINGFRFKVSGSKLKTEVLENGLLFSPDWQRYRVAQKAGKWFSNCSKVSLLMIKTPKNPWTIK